MVMEIVIKNKKRLFIDNYRLSPIRGKEKLLESSEKP